jgi:hypothetical protein
MYTDQGRNADRQKQFTIQSTYQSPHITYLQSAHIPESLSYTTREQVRFLSRKCRPGGGVAAVRETSIHNFGMRVVPIATIRSASTVVQYHRYHRLSLLILVSPGMCTKSTTMTSAIATLLARLGHHHARLKSSIGMACCYPPGFGIS